MVTKAPRGIAIRLLVTGGIIAGVIFIAQRLSLGSRISEGAFSLGSTAGNAITAPIAGLATSLADGLQAISGAGGNLFDSALDVGADFQQTITGNRNAIGDFVTGIQNFGSEAASGGSQGKKLTTSEGNAVNPKPQVNIQNLLSIDNIKRRIETATKKAENPDTKGPTTPFGGFGSALEQETQLQLALAEAQKNFPQFFN